MITGFNTDIDFEGKTYHVQTEDKGLSRPILLSLVYDGGTILASKRAPYDDLLSNGLDEAILAERLQKQHRTICAAIKSGRLEDLKRMSEREASNKSEPQYAGFSVGAIPKPSDLDLDLRSIPATLPESDSAVPIPKPEFDEIEGASTEPTFEDFAIIEEEIVLQDEAIEIISEMVGKERPANNKLTIELFGESRFKGGERRVVSVMVCRGSSHKIVSDAEVMIKIIGSSFRPLIFHATTDGNGIAMIDLQFPAFSEGRAALLVRAISGGEEVELRRPVTRS